MKVLVIVNTVFVIMIIILIVYQMHSMNRRFESIKFQIQNPPKPSAEGGQVEISSLSTKIDELDQKINSLGCAAGDSGIEACNTDSIEARINEISTKLQTIESSIQASSGDINSDDVAQKITASLNTNNIEFCNAECRESIAQKITASLNTNNIEFCNAECRESIAATISSNAGNTGCDFDCQRKIAKNVIDDLPYDEMACKIFSANIFRPHDPKSDGQQQAGDEYFLNNGEPISAGEILGDIWNNRSDSLNITRIESQGRKCELRENAQFTY